MTFSTWRPNPKVNLDSGFAQGVFSKRGFDEYLVLNGGNDWYQSDAMPGALKFLRGKLSGYSRVISYSASMGAYACLNFSSEISANQSYCFSPQFSIDPVKVPFEKRWVSEASKISFMLDHGGVNINHDTDHFIFFDPDGPDALHANLFRQNSIIRVPLRYSGHFSLSTLKSIQVLNRFIDEICDNTFDPRKFLKVYNRLVRKSPWRPVAVAEKSSGKTSRVLRAFDAFWDSKPDDPVLYEKMGLFLLLSKLPEKSEELLRLTPDLANRPYALSLLARSALANGDDENARSLAMEAGRIVGFDHPYLAPLSPVLE